MRPHSLHSSNSFIRLCFISFSVFFLLLASSVFGQDTTKPVYTSLAYIKVKPGKGEAYRELIKNYSLKVFQAQVKKGSIIGWYLNEVLMPSGASVEYDYVGVTVSTSLQEVLDPVGTMKENLKKTFPALQDKQIDEVVAKYAEARSIVKREIYTNFTWASPPGGVPAKYAQVAFQQPKPGKLTESLNWEKNTWGPIHKACLEMKGMNNWAVLVLYLPQDINTGYSYITVNFFDELSQYEGGFKYEAAFKKAWPNLDIDKIMAQPGGDKTDVKNQLCRLVEYANSTNTK
jgi:hypothetical protein